MGKSNEEIARLIALTTAQEKAWKALVKAVNDCKKQNVFFYQCMEHLGAMNGNNVFAVVGYEETGEPMHGPLSTGNYSIPSVVTVGPYADDTHHIVLTPNV